jgi:hypothetical protein
MAQLGYGGGKRWHTNYAQIHWPFLDEEKVSLAASKRGSSAAIANLCSWGNPIGRGGGHGSGKSSQP